MTQVQGFAADTGKPSGFDDGFRARLRDLLVWRRDVRCFRRDPLPAGTLERLIHLACLAPSVGLSQPWRRSEEHTSELQSRPHLVCRLLLEKKKAPGNNLRTTGVRRRHGALAA